MKSMDEAVASSSSFQKRILSQYYQHSTSIIVILASTKTKDN